MNNTKKYIWSAYVLLWVYFIFFDQSYEQSDHIGSYLFFGWIPFLALTLIWRNRSKKTNGLETNTEAVKEQKVESSSEVNKQSHSFWLWWKTDPKDIDDQVKNYDKLKITKSYRGISFLIMIFSAIATVVLYVLKVATVEYLVDLLFILPLGFFMLRGSKWSFIVGMIYWTYAKGYQLFSQVGVSSPIIPIIWWIIYMGFFYRAFMVEKRKELLKL